VECSPLVLIPVKKGAIAMRAWKLLVAVSLLLSGASVSAQRKYDFLMYPADSDLNVRVSVQSFTSGTLVGNYNPNTNPTGTRTKPGIFSSFGPTENVPVPVEVNPSVEGC
jgi:hypothetical protein